MLEVILGPRTEKDQPVPAAAALKRMGGYAKSMRLLAEKPVLELILPTIIFPKWWLCFVRGRLVKRFSLPDGSTRELPVCHARVHIWTGGGHHAGAACRGGGGQRADSHHALHQGGRELPA